MEPILAETYGLIVYQEQVQQIAHVLAGYSLGAADVFRRVLARRKYEAIEAERATFVEGCCTTSGISARLAETIFDTLQRYAGYVFNKAHSTSYAILAYRSAYLKAHYREAFMDALASSSLSKSRTP